MALFPCPECQKEISDSALACPHCGFPLKPLPTAFTSAIPVSTMPYGITYGYEYKSKATLFGLPLVHITKGFDPVTRKKRISKGIIAIGDIAVGGLAIGGVSAGVFAIGGIAAGLITFGGLSVGLLAALGGLAVGSIAFGGMAVGITGLGGGMLLLHPLIKFLIFHKSYRLTLNFFTGLALYQSEVGTGSGRRVNMSTRTMPEWEYQSALLKNAPTRTVTPSLTLPSDRLLGLDSVRVLATLGVIWFHAAESSRYQHSGILGRFSVAFYTMAAMVFLVSSASKHPHSWRTYVASRFARLYPSFIAWSAITFLVLYIWNSYNGKVELPTRSWSLLVDGGTVHLWYIPFLFIASSLVYPVILWMTKPASPRQRSIRQWTIAGACVALAAAMDLQWLPQTPSVHLPVLDTFFNETRMRWSGVPWGVAFGIFWINGYKHFPYRRMLAFLGVLLVIAMIVLRWNGGNDVTYKIYGGIGLLLIALAPWNNPVVRFLAPYGRMSAGVYFAHMAAIYAMRAFADQAGAGDGDWARDLVVYSGSILLSFGSVAFLACIPGLQWLAGYASDRKLPTPSGHLRPTFAGH